MERLAPSASTYSAFARLTSAGVVELVVVASLGVVVGVLKGRLKNIPTKSAFAAAPADNGESESKKNDDCTRAASKITTAPADNGESESKKNDDCTHAASKTTTVTSAPAPLLWCIRHRRSVMPRSYLKNGPGVSRATVERLLEAAMWAPFHGSVPPWRFVVLGKQSMVDMQRLTLEFYDKHWRTVGWADGKHGTAEEYAKWRDMTEGEISGRWAPVSFMVAIVMRRQAGSVRIPEWEEAAATACAHPQSPLPPPPHLLLPPLSVLQLALRR